MESRQSGDDPEANCLPTGVPRIARTPGGSSRPPAYQESHTPLFRSRGTSTSYRNLHGRPQAIRPIRPHMVRALDRMDEGDTLVIDTIGFNDRFWFDFRGHPHTDKLTRSNAGRERSEHARERDHDRRRGPPTRSRFKVSFTARLHRPKS